MNATPFGAGPFILTRGGGSGSDRVFVCTANTRQRASRQSMSFPFVRQSESGIRHKTQHVERSLSLSLSSRSSCVSLLCLAIHNFGPIHFVVTHQIIIIEKFSETKYI